jgi:hypothetical protein
MVHVSNLWPLPGEVAAQRLAFWRDLRSKAAAFDPAKSERPAYDAKSRADMLRDIDAVLADPHQLVAQAWFHWALYLGAAAVAAFTAFAAFRRWRHWPWLAGACAIVYFWLYRPHTPVRFFYLEGHFDFSGGVSQLAIISQYPGPFFAMVINAVVAVLLVVVVAIAFVSLYKAGITHAP